MSYFDTLTWLDFFANWGRSTPRGRGQSYIIWTKSALFLIFAKIVKIPRKNDFRDQSAQIFSQFGGDHP
jgi:putative Ca2+/H+ antiporter (TMEM165/GDT1 family)